MSRTNPVLDNISEYLAIGDKSAKVIYSYLQQVRFDARMEMSRLLPYCQHKADCAMVNHVHNGRLAGYPRVVCSLCPPTFGDDFPSTCDCGLDELKRELESA